MSNDPLKREVLFKSDLLDERTLKLSTRLIRVYTLNGNQYNKKLQWANATAIRCHGHTRYRLEEKGPRNPGGGGTPL